MRCSTYRVLLSFYLFVKNIDEIFFIAFCHRYLLKCSFLNDQFPTRIDVMVKFRWFFTGIMLVFFCYIMCYGFVNIWKHLYKQFEFNVNVKIEFLFSFVCLFVQIRWNKGRGKWMHLRLPWNSLIHLLAVRRLAFGAKLHQVTAAHDANAPQSSRVCL